MTKRKGEDERQQDYNSSATDLELVDVQEIFQKHIDGKTIKELAEEYGVSTRTIDVRLAKARDLVYNDLKETGKREAAKQWRKLERLEKKAWEQLELTADTAWSKELREIWKQQAELFAIKAPPQAAVNQNGDVVPDKLIFVIDDTKFKQLEAKAKGEIIDGEIKEVTNSGNEI